MTPAEAARAKIARLREMEAKALRNWCSGCPEDGRLFCHTQGAEIANFHTDWAIPKHVQDANTRLAIASRNALPALLDLLEALLDERESAVEIRTWDEFQSAIERVDAALARLGEG